MSGKSSKLVRKKGNERTLYTLASYPHEIK